MTQKTISREALEARALAAVQHYREGGFYCTDRIAEHVYNFLLAENYADVRDDELTMLSLLRALAVPEVNQALAGYIDVRKVSGVIANYVTFLGILGTPAEQAELLAIELKKLPENYSDEELARLCQEYESKAALLVEA